MSNSPNFEIDFSIPILTFIGVAVSDGTWSDVILSTKTDQAGQEAPASLIPVAAGQLWSNLVDDFMIAVYRLNAGAEIQEIDTTDATPDAVKTLFTLPSDGKAVRIRVEAFSCDGATKFLDGELGGMFYRTGGTVNVFNAIDTIALVGFATADAELQINGDDIDLVVTGEAATNIAWKLKITQVEEVRVP